MQYCLDTNVYIEAHRRYYAFDIAPGFWDGIRRLAENQVVCSPSLVYDEIMNANYKDDLTQWAKANRELVFLEADDSTQQSYSTIADMVDLLYQPQHVEKFLSGADLWVIARAKAHNLTVVTMESLKVEQKDRNGKIGGKIHIPNVCNHAAIKYRDTFALLREQNIVLR